MLRPPRRAATRARAPPGPRTRKTTAPSHTARMPRARPARGVGSQTGRMIEKRPGQMEPDVEVFGQRLDPHRLGGVVPGVKHVQLQLFGVEERVVGTLARDEGVEAGGGGLRDHRTRVRDLQPVDRVGRVRYLQYPEVAVHVGDQLGELHRASHLWQYGDIVSPDYRQ